MWFDIIKADLPYVGRKGTARELYKKKHIDIVENLLLKLKQEIPQLNWESSGFVKGAKGETSTIHQPFTETSQIYIFHRIGASDSEFLITIMAPAQDEPPKHLTAEEIITKIKKHIIEPRERAKQWIIETANKLDYVTINGDWIEIEPEWGKSVGFQGFNRPVNLKYVFNMNNIHDELCIIRVITDSSGNIHESDVCLSESNRFDAPIADSYVTVMLLANDKDGWNSMWDDA